MELLIQVILLIIGFVLLIKGADVFVDGASNVAYNLKIPTIIVGLTIVAFGTSAPEAAVSITSAFQGVADITVGNIVGSNIFNILFVVGISSLIIPVPFAKAFIIDMLIAIASTVFLIVVSRYKRSLPRWSGFVMLAGYVGYMFYLL